MKRKLRKPSIHGNHLGYQIEVRNNTMTTEKGVKYNYDIDFYIVVKNKLGFIPYESKIGFEKIIYSPKKELKLKRIETNSFNDMKKIMKKLKTKYILTNEYNQHNDYNNLKN